MSRFTAGNRFQEMAIRLPFFNQITRHYLRDLFGLMTGFVGAQVLAACVELDLFTQLRGGPKSLSALCFPSKIKPREAARLMQTAESFGLVKINRRGDYALTLKGSAIAADPGIAVMVKHHARLYQDLQSPLALFETPMPRTELRDFWHYTDPESAATEDKHSLAYSDVMAASQPMVIDAVLAGFPFHHHKRILDIGGGHGGFLTRLLSKVPELEATLADLPPVADDAKAKLANTSVAQRIKTTGMAFRVDAFPPDHDLITMIRIAFDHPDERLEMLFSKAFEALDSGGRLLIAEPMASKKRSRAAINGYFDMYLLAMGGGRLRTVEEFASLLRRAGFEAPRPHKSRTPELISLLSARKP
ncbi:MAG: methyltransferase [Pseudomonadota bacterium]